MTTRQKVNALGYALARNQKDMFGRKRAYRASPTASLGGGGPTNYFDTAAQVTRWVEQVRQVREWQAEPLEQNDDDRNENTPEG